MAIRGDLPFYNGQPVAISPAGWAMLVASVLVATGLLITLPLTTFPLNLLPAVLFTGVPLVTLGMLSGWRLGALFGHFGIKDFFIALGFGLLTMLVSMGVGLVLFQFTSMTANAATDMLSGIGTFDLVVFLIRTFIQLIGEEVMTILPLLAVLWLCVNRFNLSRRVGLVVAVIVSTLWFAAIHLPTYNWNLIQCFGGIGAARLVLTMAFVLTRKLWVSAGAHIVNDWSEFFLPMLVEAAGGHTPIGTGG